MISSELVTAAVWGALLTIFIEIIAILIYLTHQPVIPNKTPISNPYVHAQSPQAVNDVYETPDDQREVESCHWLNAIVDFVFHELRDTPLAKKLTMKLINKEFTEFLQTKMEGKFFESLTVREYSFGKSLPTFSNVKLIELERDEDFGDRRPQLVKLELDVDYTGEFELGIDAELMFNRNAYVLVRINRVKGQGWLCFTRHPHTHFWFSFTKDPHLELDVTSRFEGRNLPRLSNFIESQLRRWVKKHHTNPFHKERFKPIFRKYKHHNQLQDIYHHNQLLTLGDLKVEVVECTRLTLVDLAIDVYCTLSIDPTPQEPVIGLWKDVWPLYEAKIVKKQEGQSLGIRYIPYTPEDDRKAQLVIITQILQNTPADGVGLMKGDVLYKVDNVRVTSLQHAKRLIEKLSNTKRVLITVRRPTYDLLKYSNISKNPSHNRSRSQTESFTRSRSKTISTVTKSLEHSEEFEIISHTSATQPGPLNASLSYQSRSIDVTDTNDIDGMSLTSQPLEPPDINRTRNHFINDELISSLSREASTNTVAKNKTKKVAVSRNPIWKDSFHFSINSKDQKYLNICVRCTLQGDDGDIMIGYVSISLSDIAAECSLVSSGYHQQLYVLVPMEVSKTSASHAALKLSSGKNELPVTAKIDKLIGSKRYVGDIMLRFLHTSYSEDVVDMNTPSTADGAAQEDVSVEEENDDESIYKKFSEYHPFTIESGSEPRRHHFKSVDLKKSDRKCHVCSQKIWKKALQCQRCLIVTDKKHLAYCRKVVPCRKVYHDDDVDGDDNKSQSWESVPSNIHESEQPFIPPLTITGATASGRTPTPVTDLDVDSDLPDGDTEVNSDIKEIEEKILTSQNIVEMLAGQRVEVLAAMNDDNVSTDSKENLQHKLTQIEAQFETTDIILKQQKETLRLLL